MTRIVAYLTAGIIAASYLLGAASANSASESIVYSFQGGANDGAYPFSAPIKVKGTLYGATAGGGGTGCGGPGCGTLYSVDPNNGTENVLHYFGAAADGALPGDTLINVGGVLYGVTSEGGGTGCGGSGCGTVFAYDLVTGKESVVYSFCSQQSCADGALPNGALLDVNGTLYGATYSGGAGMDTACASEGCGTLFSLDLATGIESVLYSFCSSENCADGAGPGGKLIDVDGILYGVAGGGTSVENCGTPLPGCGVVFSYNLNTNEEAVTYSFCSQKYCADGSWPAAGLLSTNGKLYGATTAGGATRGSCSTKGGCGSVFSLDPSTGTETVAYTFCKNGDLCKTGYQPNGDLIGVSGKLFGTTAYGGTGTCLDRCGTVFSVDLSTKREKVLYSFAGGTDGAYSYSGLLDVKGAFYGTTEFGGTGGSGTIFAITR